MRINSYESNHASMAPKVPLHTFINNIDASVFLQLTEILDINATWKKLISVLPKGNYSASDVYHFEQESLRYMGGPSQSLLQDLGNRGVTVGMLIPFLESLQLERALVLLKEFEPVTLTNDLPSNVVAQCGAQCQFKLECFATGFPRPTFQWFKFDPSIPDWIELLDQCNNNLYLNPVRMEDEGDYCCRATNFRPNDSNNACSVFTNVVTIRMKPEMVSRVYRDPDQTDAKIPPVIIIQPCCPSQGPFRMGSSLAFTCEARSSTAVQHEWFRNGRIIPGEEKSLLYINNLQPIDDETKFTIQCRVSNCYGSIMSKLVTIPLAPPSENAQFFAEDKVALVIGNCEYQNLDVLNSPKFDATTISRELMKMDFKVLTLVDLTLQEMCNAVDEFCSLLERDVYAVFYYAGHGFQVQGQRYMIPVDAKTYNPEHSLCIEDVQARIQCRDPALCCFLMDMCRVDPYRETCGSKENIVTYYPKVNRNVVRAFATSDFCSALDGHKGSNGIFMKHLKKFICMDKPIKEIMDLVVQEISVDPQASRRQYPETSSNLGRPLKLTDRIRSQSPSAQDRCNRFRMLTDAPQPVTIRRAVTTEITFEPFGHIVHNILDIKLATDNKEYVPYIKEIETSLNEKVLFDHEPVIRNGNISHVQATISNLQKIQGEITLEVHLFHPKTIEIYKVTLGRPLIACANLWHRPRIEGTEEDESGFVSDLQSLSPSLYSPQSKAGLKDLYEANKH